MYLSEYGPNQDLCENESHNVSEWVLVTSEVFKVPAKAMPKGAAASVRKSARHPAPTKMFMEWCYSVHGKHTEESWNLVRKEIGNLEGSVDRECDCDEILDLDFETGSESDIDPEEMN